MMSCREQSRGSLPPEWFRVVVGRLFQEPFLGIGPRDLQLAVESFMVVSLVWFPGHAPPGQSFGEFLWGHDHSDSILIVGTPETEEWTGYLSDQGVRLLQGEVSIEFRTCPQVKAFVISCPVLLILLSFHHLGVDVSGGDSVVTEQGKAS